MFATQAATVRCLQVWKITVGVIVPTVADTIEMSAMLEDKVECARRHLGTTCNRVATVNFSLFTVN